MSEIAVRVQKALREAAGGKPMEARAALLQLASRYPDEPRIHAGLTDLMLGLGDLNTALNHAAAWAQLSPDQSAPHRQIGRIMALSQRPDIAAKAFAKALEIDPKDLDARASLAGVHLLLGRAVDAMEASAAGLTQRPGDPRLTMLLARSQMNLARIEDAVAILRAAIAAHPRDVDLAETLSVALNYLPDAPPAETLATHRRHAELAAARHRVAPQRHRSTLGADARPVNIGFLSADLRGHSVGFFIEPLLEHLDPERFAVHCYFTGRNEDATSQRLRAMSKVWRAVGDLEPGLLAKAIAADKIDILIDLAGLSMGHRLAALAAKPAPVIVNYLGYPNTTGCQQVTARLVDSHTDPAPSAESNAVERLIRIDPCFLCYRPPADAPAPGREPSDTITFGCFNALPKFNDRLFGLWSRVLERVPSARLLIKNAGLIDERSRESIAQRMIAAGISRDRFELAPWTTGRGDHLLAYSRVDIALDTFPYHGTTTTCESLLMGVPVVTLAGEVHASRVGASLLNAVGHTEWIAQTPDDYIAIAARLAGDATQRARLRNDLRPAMLASSLCDAHGFARRFATALETLWNDWLKGAGR